MTTPRPPRIGCLFLRVYAVIRKNRAGRVQRVFFFFPRRATRTSR